LANEFIIANRPYIPSGVERLADYVSNKKKKYFQHLDVTNARTQLAMRKNTETIAQKLETVNSKYRFSVFYTLWSQAAASKLNEVSDFVYKTYLKELALSTDNTQAILDIEAHNRLRLGAIAPDIVWVDDKKELKLSELEAAERYILVFWSSTCGHCLNELPALHKELRKHPAVKVLAVGLEDHDISWKNEAKKLPNFEHTIALGKWDSEYADLYNITATPTYFVLDSDKRIIAKPASLTARYFVIIRIAY